MSPSGNATAEQYPHGEVTVATAVLAGPGKFRVEERQLRACGAKDVRIDLEGCGICASSIPVWEGRPWFNYPFPGGAPGHEGWGIVSEIGAEVTQLKVGQRVAFLGDSAFAEGAVVPAQHAVPLPVEVDGVPFPGEAIGCAMNIFSRSHIGPQDTVAVIGAGFLGLLLIELARAQGARVFAFSRREFARNLALECGAEAVFDTDDWWGNAQKVVGLTNGTGCSRVIETTGLQFGLDTATELIAEYGKLIIAGYHQDGLRQVNMQKWNWRAIDVINAHERSMQRYLEGVQQGVNATAAGKIHPAKLLTHRFSLGELDAGFQMMNDRPDGFVKGWVKL